MKRVPFLLATACALLVAATSATPARANSTGSLATIDELVSFWEQQAAKGNPPQAQNCEDLRAMLARAEAELAAEKKAYEESLKNPPKNDNANGGIVAGWVRNRNAEAKRLRDAEKKVKDLRRRLDALCPLAGAGGK